MFPQFILEHYEVKLHWIGEYFCVCMFLDSRDNYLNMFQNVSVRLTRFTWIPRTYTCNVIFVGTFNLLRISQQANIASCSGFRNCKWVPQNISGIRKCKSIPQSEKEFRICLLLDLHMLLRNLKART